MPIVQINQPVEAPELRCTEGPVVICSNFAQKSTKNMHLPFSLHIVWALCGVGRLAPCGRYV